MDQSQISSWLVDRINPDRDQHVPVERAGGFSAPKRDLTACGPNHITIVPWQGEARCKIPLVPVNLLVPEYTPSAFSADARM